MARNKTVTTSDIAEHLGLAQSTVANVLNRSRGPKYSQATCERVFSTAQKLGYQQSALRRAIKAPLKELGILLSNTGDLESTFYHSILNGVYEGAMKHRYSMRLQHAEWELGNFEDAKQKARKLVEMFESRLLDGVLVDKSRFGSLEMEILEDAEVPFVCINGKLPNRDREVERMAYWVCVDHFKGGRMATKHLLALGHRRIVMVNPEMSQYPLHWMPSSISMRIAGYQAAMHEAGLDEGAEKVVEASLTKGDVVHDVMARLMQSPQPPTAVFAADDGIAILVMNSLRRLGYSIPEDVSVVGYGNWHVAYLASPALTTVSVPWKLMGEQGTDMLIALIEGKSLDQHAVILDTSMSVGASTAPVT